MDNNIFIFKKLTVDHIDLLYQWSCQPHISKWWEFPTNKEDFHDKYTTALQSPARGCFLIIANNSAIGYAQWYIANRFIQLFELQDNVYGIDFFIGNTQYIGKGYGTASVQSFVHFIFRTTRAQAIIADPEISNLKAIECFKKSGFRIQDEFQQAGKDFLMMKIYK